MNSGCSPIVLCVALWIVICSCSILAMELGIFSTRGSHNLNLTLKPRETTIIPRRRPKNAMKTSMTKHRMK
jgi:hypothetical protein